MGQAGLQVVLPAGLRVVLPVGAEPPAQAGLRVVLRVAAELPGRLAPVMRRPRAEAAGVTGDREKLARSPLTFDASGTFLRIVIG